MIQRLIDCINALSVVTTRAKDKVISFHPVSGSDIFKIIYEAKENGLKIKCHGGSFPLNKEGADIVISLRSMKQMVCYDLEEETFTFEGGLALSEVLQCLEYQSLTLELHGIVPDLTVADAISLGLIGSNGSIANCLQSCQILHPDGTLMDWAWPSSEQNQSDIPKEQNVVPTLQSMVCGLGVVGIINSATFKCIPIRLAQETVYTGHIDDIINDTHKLSDRLYSYMYWYPLLDKAVVQQATSVRLHLAHLQPWWKKCTEMILWGIHWVMNRTSPVICWYFPSLARSLSQLQFDLLMKASSCRMHYSFRPQTLIPVTSHCRGVKWCLPADRLQDAVEDIGNWAEHRFHLCSSPIVISIQTHKGLNVRQPFLSPYTHEKTCTLWTDWFNSQSLVSSFSTSMAEFETLLQKNGGRKCWSAGPVYASPLIGQMYPGFRQWCETRQIIDPGAIFRSAYVSGDLFVEQ